LFWICVFLLYICPNKKATMKNILFYFRLLRILVINFGTNVDLLIDDSASNTGFDVKLIKNSLYLMVLFNFNIAVIVGGNVIRIFDEEDIDKFISSYKFNNNPFDLAHNLSKISKKSILLCYSDFYLSDDEFIKINKYKTRLLVSHSERSGSPFDSEISFI
jgi:hypothetical protein